MADNAAKVGSAITDASLKRTGANVEDMDTEETDPNEAQALFAIYHAEPINCSFVPCIKRLRPSAHVETLKTRLSSSMEASRRGLSLRASICEYKGLLKRFAERLCYCLMPRRLTRLDETIKWHIVSLSMLACLSLFVAFLRTSNTATIPPLKNSTVLEPVACNGVSQAVRRCQIQ
ncbi:hypothetical protein BC830DRAFT_1158657 [Chytriomyces sp. MP71]|nr:hypothetical protein BC830DRAFT_1158657 [Chytriomyces sp. MP71]